MAYLTTKHIKCLKHVSSIHEYVNESSTLMLEIPNITEKGLLLDFIDNLQIWTKHEFRHYGNHSTILTLLESLVVFLSQSP